MQILWLLHVLGGQTMRVKVVVLTQRRVDGLQRVLKSLQATEAPKNASIDVQISIDNAMQPKYQRDRAAVVAVAWEWIRTWSRGIATVVERKDWLGVRGHWLSIRQGAQRLLIVEDDVRLSPAWYEFLSMAEAIEPLSSAGISLQRQGHRLDEYKDEPKLHRLYLDDQLFLFTHVGAWGFSPHPVAWRRFRKWFYRFRDPNDYRAWSTGVDGLPLDASRSPLYRETLVSRWYRDSLRTSRGDSMLVHRARPEAMWTAHFDCFCATHGLLVLHASFGHNKYGFAVSYRDDGEHYQGFAKPDARLVHMQLWRHRVRPALFDPFRYVAKKQLPCLGVDGKILLGVVCNNSAKSSFLRGIGWLGL